LSKPDSGKDLAVENFDVGRPAAAQKLVHRSFTLRSMTMKSQCTEARKIRSSNSSAATAAMAIAGRSSRACDVCGVQRAHWYCAADEAFLCENCDGGVHNANAVALRHERVRLAPNGTPTAKLPRHSSASQCHLSNPPANVPEVADRMRMTATLSRSSARAVRTRNVSMTARSWT